MKQVASVHAQIKSLHVIDSWFGERKIADVNVLDTARMGMLRMKIDAVNALRNKNVDENSCGIQKSVLVNVVRRHAVTHESYEIQKLADANVRIYSAGILEVILTIKHVHAVEEPKKSRLRMTIHRLSAAYEIWRCTLTQRERTYQ